MVKSKIVTGARVKRLADDGGKKVTYIYKGNIHVINRYYEVSTNGGGAGAG